MSELRECESCQYFNPYERFLPVCGRPRDEKHYSGYWLCMDERKGSCGVSAVYFEPLEPSIDELKTICDGYDDVQPKTPPTQIETRETF